MKKIIVVAGARPNFMKVAPILRELRRHDAVFTGLLVHTGQHYDKNMSDDFFSSLGIPFPDHNLEVGSGSHAVQTAAVMVRFEEVCVKEAPDAVIVVGDVNSTIAAGLVATKLHIPLCHVEAGLRSGDRTMPEEINRIATDAITDVFFTTEPEGAANLLREGHPREAIHFVGHVMIDNLLHQCARISAEGDRLICDPVRALKSALPEQYLCLTMHRPSNVDDRETLSRLLDAINGIAQYVPIVFPCHPRTRKKIEEFKLPFHTVENYRDSSTISSGLIVTEPLGYNDFLYLWKNSTGVLTDSGGLQEETTALRIPCITMRTATERPITAEVGSNEIAGTDGKKIVELARKILTGTWKKSRIPELWDGKASERIVEVLGRKMGVL